MSVDFLNELNDAQREAVVNTRGPALVIAGAGAGKTRVLTYRIAYLLHNGIEAGDILALTFTNKAAGEMKERIKNIAGYENTRHLWMGTFHSIFARILRKDLKLGKLPKDCHKPVRSRSQINMISTGEKEDNDDSYENHYYPKPR